MNQTIISAFFIQLPLILVWTAHILLIASYTKIVKDLRKAKEEAEEAKRRTCRLEEESRRIRFEMEMLRKRTER